MKAKFFLSLDAMTKASNYEILELSSEKFLKCVKELCQDHELNAKVYPAAMVIGNRENEEYGVLVELTYGFTNELDDAVKTLGWATNQKSILVDSEGEYTPRVFKISKVADIGIPDEETLLGAVLDLHYTHQDWYRRTGKSFTSVVYEKPDGIFLHAVSAPDVEPNADYWQLCFSKFCKDNGMLALVKFALVHRYEI